MRFVPANYICFLKYLYAVLVCRNSSWTQLVCIISALCYTQLGIVILTALLGIASIATRSPKSHMRVSVFRQPLND